MTDEAESYGEDQELSWPPGGGGLDLSKLPDESTGDPDTDYGELDLSRRPDLPGYEGDDYGVKMTEGLANAVQSVMDMGYDEFSSEEGAADIQRALYEAEEAPEANIFDDYLRRLRIGRALNPEQGSDVRDESDTFGFDFNEPSVPDPEGPEEPRDFE